MYQCSFIHSWWCIQWSYLQGIKVPECSIWEAVDVISMHQQDLELPEASK